MIQDIHDAMRMRLKRAAPMLATGKRRTRMNFLYYANNNAALEIAAR